MLTILVTLVFVGVLLYLLTLIPMDPAIVQIIRVLVILSVVCWVISLFFGGAFQHSARFGGI